MSLLHVCSLSVELDRYARISARSLPRIIRAIDDIFHPTDISYRTSSSDMVTLCVPVDNGLWAGERRTEGELTDFSPEDGSSLIEALTRTISAPESSLVWFSFTGALRFYAGSFASPSWHGRWQRPAQELYELVQVRMNISPGLPRELEVVFPLIGYPLTASTLNEFGLTAGNPAVADSNRRLILPAIARLPQELGLENEWTVGGEFTWDYPEDALAITKMLART